MLIDAGNVNIGHDRAIGFEKKRTHAPRHFAIIDDPRGWNEKSCDTGNMWFAFRQLSLADPMDLKPVGDGTLVELFHARQLF
ncbi:hypothetical protein D3C87_2014270 [compost metagenome]